MMANTNLAPEDERAIVALHNAYAAAADTKDRALLDTCFAQGATADYGELGAFATREALMDGVMGLVAHVGTTLHFMSNFTIRADGEGALSRCYTQAVVNVPGLDAPVRTAGIYDDRLVRENGEWRIAHRVYTTVA